MKLKKARGFVFLGIAMILFLWTMPAMAAEFPTKPVTLIVPWAPGGSTDVCMRVLARDHQ